MKKKKWIFVILLIVAMVIIFLGFDLYSVASLPFQDSEFVSASILEKQVRDIMIGKIAMLIGATLLFGTIIWRKRISH